MLRLVERMKVLAIICLLSILSLPRVVNAAEKRESAASARRVIRTLRDRGLNKTFSIGIGPYLGMTEDAPAKLLLLKDGPAEQQTWHIQAVVAVSSALAMSVVPRFGSERVEHHFRLSLDGRLEKALRTVGRYDEAGQAVPGTGVDTLLPVDSPETEALLSKELDFVLSRYAELLRKPAQKTKAGSKKP